MTRDNDDQSSKDKELSHGFDTKPAGNKQRQEPTFSRYDEDEAYEEPDRDADYTSGFHENDVEDDDEFDDDSPEEDEPDLFEDDDTEYDDDPAYDDEADTWQEKESYFEQDDAPGQTWPLGLIAVAIVALVLLAAGGYGVMQQRAATENELRELRAALAIQENPTGPGANRDALEELQQAFDTLSAEAETLRLETRTLSDTVTGLEAQLGKQQTLSPVPAVAAQAQPNTVNESTPKPAQPTAAPAKTPAPTVSKPVESRTTEAKPATVATAGPWFVNFGSYATRNMAESWAARLHPDAGKVTIIPTTSDGRTLYRLRVIGLADRESAKQVARKLETSLRVSELWVGKE